MTCCVFVATSRDGFIARPDGAIDRLTGANVAVPPGEDCGYAEFMSTVDALIMGRRTFEQALCFEAWPYEATPVFVLSRSMAELPARTPGSVSLSAEVPAALVEHLSARGFRRLYVDGGLTIQSFLAEGLIDELTITTVPLLLGAGRCLFGPLPADLHLEHLATRVFDFGFVQSRYRVATGT